jgi:1,4-alpha-glucan branching enzyme
MVRLANTYKNPIPLVRRALNQAARELMLAESSDWAFIMDAKTMVDYAVRRTKHHVNRFRALATMVRNQAVDEDFLSQLERMDNLFPNIDYRVYCSACHGVSNQPDNYSRQTDHNPRLRILMLSWEFPPMTVGGLSRHVYDLSRHLVRQGCEVHVVTTAIGGAPLHEVVEGVHVHRVNVLKPDGGEFIHFVLQLNLMMLDRCRALIDDEGYAFDLIHAHDWLVSEVAKALKRRYQLPLIATIHATEHGRNQGIYTDVQRHIHQREWELTYEAHRIIVCSSFMKREVESVFNVPAEKITVLPNGVDKRLLQVPSHENSPLNSLHADGAEPMVLFIGRLVPEKGVHVLLQAAPAILQEFPHAKFVVVGKGPMMDQLVATAQQLGIADRVAFLGFVADEERNRLLGAADVAVFPSLYEPFGIVALEAMAAGTPVVASYTGGLVDVVQHEHNGLTVYPNDAQSLATQIKRILGDPDFATQLSHTAEMELVRFDWSYIAEETIHCYQTVLESDPEKSVDPASESV